MCKPSDNFLRLIRGIVVYNHDFPPTIIWNLEPLKGAKSLLEQPRTIPGADGDSDIDGSQEKSRPKVDRRKKFDRWSKVNGTGRAKSSHIEGRVEMSALRLTSICPRHF